MYKVVMMIILVNWVNNFRPPKFQKSSLLTPIFKSWVKPWLASSLETSHTPSDLWLC